MEQTTLKSARTRRCQKKSSCGQKSSKLVENHQDNDKVLQKIDKLNNMPLCTVDYVKAEMKRKNTSAEEVISDYLAEVEIIERD